MIVVEMFTKPKKFSNEAVFLREKRGVFKNDNFGFFYLSSDRIFFRYFFQKFVNAFSKKIVRFFIFELGLLITIFDEKIAILFAEFINTTNSRFVLTNVFVEIFKKIAVFFEQDC